MGCRHQDFMLSRAVAVPSSASVVTVLVLTLLNQAHNSLAIEEPPKPGSPDEIPDLDEVMASDKSSDVNSAVSGDVVVHFDTAKKGYIQRPRLPDAPDKSLQERAHAVLKVPTNHKVLISLTWAPEYLNSTKGFHCSQSGSISLRFASTDIKLSCLDLPRPLLYEAETVQVDYHGDLGRNEWQRSVRLQFSFVRPNLTRFPSGQFNCSELDWPVVEQHFLCNLKTECAGQEDEMNCSYVSSCGPGYITTSTGCYLYLEQSMTGTEAKRTCADHRALLASLRGPQEWQQMTQLLRKHSHSDITFFGLDLSSPALPKMYRDTFQWTDGSVAHYVLGHSIPTLSSAGLIAFHFKGSSMGESSLTVASANARGTAVMCKSQFWDNNRPYPLRLPEIAPYHRDNYITCPKAHVTHMAFACDPLSHCWAHYGTCQAPLAPLPPSFRCTGCKGGHVPFSDVCNHRKDCDDNSDEDFCIFPVCSVDDFTCAASRQCVPQQAWCDGRKDCNDGSDEERCPRPGPGGQYNRTFFSLGFDFMRTTLRLGFGFMRVDLNVQGLLQTTPIHSDPFCPPTHFTCPSQSNLCLPIFLGCNGVYDCPGHEDEAQCDTYTCPGDYRCRQSLVCLHMDSVCDGVAICPLGDDELFCADTCPLPCACLGQAYFCTQPFPVSSSPQLRFLDATGSGMTLRDVSRNNNMLIHLSLAKCRLTPPPPNLALNLPNLRYLDLSYNNLFELSSMFLIQLPNLRELSLTGNPLSMSALLFGPHKMTGLTQIRSLDLSHTFQRDLRVSSLLRLGLHGLETLNLSFSGVRRIESSLNAFPHLRVIDLRGCPMTRFPSDLFRHLHQLEKVYADNYKLCCPAILPAGFNSYNCLAPIDEISSCESLLRANLYRVVLALFAVLAIGGNVGSLIYRFRDKNKRETGLVCHILVSNLCISDLLMGVYLVLIGVADFRYRGKYLSHDEEWKQSGTCKGAGFLALLSCEVSAFIICLITLDRLLALRFPLSKLRFKPWSARLLCGLVWLLGLALAAVPLLPMTSFWQFYSQTGVCIPLPITRQMFPGHTYSFGILIILNFLLFLVIAPGQVLIYLSVRRFQKENDVSQTESLTLARRLFAIAMTDFMCWFPICFLGFMAAQGCPVSGELNVVTAIFVLPLNSACNPFIYTLNLHKEEKRRQKRCCQTCQAETNVDDPRCAVYSTTTINPV